MLDTIISTLTFLAIICAACEYIRVRRWINNIMDNLIDELLVEDVCENIQEIKGPCKVHRERLSILAAGGQAKQYLGKAWTVEEIESLSEDEIEKLYTRYETRLGGIMRKSIGRAVLQLYTSAVGMFLPIPPESRQPLIEDLESDPFISNALNGTACELYYRYGKFLAPITAALTTAKYCQFGQKCNDVESTEVTTDTDRP